MPGEDAGRDLVMLLQAKGCQRLPANYQKLGERDGTDLSSEGTNPADTLILDFQPPEPGGNTFVLFQPPSMWYFVTTVRAE